MAAGWAPRWRLFLTVEAIVRFPRCKSKRGWATGGRMHSLSSVGDEPGGVPDHLEGQTSNVADLGSSYHDSTAPTHFWWAKTPEAATTGLRAQSISSIAASATDRPVADIVPDSLGAHRPPQVSAATAQIDVRSMPTLDGSSWFTSEAIRPQLGGRMKRTNQFAVHCMPPAQVGGPRPPSSRFSDLPARADLQIAQAEESTSRSWFRNPMFSGAIPMSSPGTSPRRDSRRTGQTRTFCFPMMDRISRSIWMDRVSARVSAGPRH